MSEGQAIVVSIAIVVGFAVVVCLLGDLIQRLTKGRSKLGAFHILAWLPGLIAGVVAWHDAHDHPLAWLYTPLLVAGTIYLVAFAYGALWGGLPVFLVQKLLAWFRERKGA